MTSGQLLKISEEVNAEPDLAAAANATGRIGRDGAPALWFDNIHGFNDVARGDDEHHRLVAEPCHLAGPSA